MKKNIILAAATVIALFSSIANSSAQKKAINVEDRPWGVAPWEYATQMDSHIDFEGVDLGQPYDKFISEVESKGFKTLDKQKRFTIMRGTWKGFAETKIVIYHKGGRAHLVEVYPRAVKKWDMAQAIYNVVRKDFFACSGLDEANLENLTDHNLNIGHEDDFRMKAKIQPLSLRPKTILGFFRLLRYRRDLLSKAIKSYFVKREYPEILSRRFNEFWCALRKPSIEKIVAAFDNHPEIREYYKYTHIPDETAFSSILLTNPDYEREVQPMCHYIDWENGVAGSPKTLTEGDLPQIRKSMVEKKYLLFARKFEEDAFVLNQIDDMLKEGL